MRVSLVLLFISLVTVSAHEREAGTPFEHPESEDGWSGHIHTGWESRYFSEGRDALDGDSLWASSLELGWKNFASGVWYGRSPDQDYDELHLNIAVAQSIGEVGFYAGYTHLRTPFEGLEDNELGTGLSWSGLPLDVELTVDAYHSFEADGSFWELALNREFQISDELILRTSGIYGVNQGYVADGHDGANHFALMLAPEYAISESVAITLHLVHSWALGKDASLSGDEQLIDFSHASVGLQFSF